jgi:predicted RNA-binding protein YlxR (DUF448 family)
VHPVLACIDLAVRRRAFGRAFKSPVAPDPAEVRRLVEQQAAP